MFAKTLPTTKSNISVENKDTIASWYISGVENQGFIKAQTRRLEVTEAHVFDTEGQPGRKEARLVCELDVTHGTPIIDAVRVSPSLIVHMQTCATSWTTCMADVLPL